MEEQDYIDKLWELYPNDAETPLKVINLADEAIKEFRDSAELWLLRGSLIELGDEDCPYGLEEAATCFEKAVEIDPNYIEAWEEIGHYYDVIEPNEILSRKAFKKAEELKNQ